MHLSVSAWDKLCHIMPVNRHDIVRVTHMGTKKKTTDGIAEMLVGWRRSRRASQQYEQGDAQGQSVGEAGVDVGVVFGE